MPEIEVKCHSILFEENKGSEELENVPKTRPRTKHIAIKYHHLREHVRNNTILVQHVGTKDQLDDITTKPLSRDLFSNLIHRLIGW